MSAGLAASTVTPGSTAPVVSLTVPAMVPLARDCASEKSGQRTAQIRDATEMRMMKTRTGAATRHSGSGKVGAASGRHIAFSLGAVALWRETGSHRGRICGADLGP